MTYNDSGLLTFAEFAKRFGTIHAASCLGARDAVHSAISGIGRTYRFYDWQQGKYRTS